jgi:hypothetical protein
MIDSLLGFATPKVEPAYLIPFADPAGGWFDHVRVKIFPPLATEKNTVKYLQPRRSGVRLFFPIATAAAACHSNVPLYVVEGEKKSLAVTQVGLTAVGRGGVEGWHVAGSRALHPGFDRIPLTARAVKLMPDGDVRTNVAVKRGAVRFADALERRGARVEVVMLPIEVAV